MSLCVSKYFYSSPFNWNVRLFEGECTPPPPPSQAFKVKSGFFEKGALGCVDPLTQLRRNQEFAAMALVKSMILIPKKKILPSLKLTYPLKMESWKMNFLLGRPIFRGELLNFGGCTLSLHRLWILSGFLEYQPRTLDHHHHVVVSYKFLGHSDPSCLFQVFC